MNDTTINQRRLEATKRHHERMARLLRQVGRIKDANKALEAANHLARALNRRED